MPMSSGNAVVATLLRFIAASIPMKFVDFPRPHGHWRLHRVVDRDVGRRAAFTAAQHTLAGHLLSIRRGRCSQGVGLPGWTLERRLKGVSDQAESRSGIAVDGIELAVWHGVEGLDTCLTL